MPENRKIETLETSFVLNSFKLELNLDLKKLNPELHGHNFNNYFIRKTSWELPYSRVDMCVIKTINFVRYYNWSFVNN